MAWLSAVRTKHISFDEIPTSTRVCSLHFHSGEPASQISESDPDWAPNLHLGHTDVNSSHTELFHIPANRKRQRTETEQTTDETVAGKSTPIGAVETAGEGVLILVKEEEGSNEAWPVTMKEEVDSDAAALMPVKREEQRMGEVMQVLVKREEPDEEFQFPTQHREGGEGATGGTQTCEPAGKRLRADCVCDKCEGHLVEIDRLSKENTSLRGEVEKWKMDQKFLKEDNERVKYYTGLPHFQVLIGLLTSIWPHMSHPSRLLSPFQMLFLTLMRLKLDLPIQHMGYLFHVDRRTVSNTFNETICALNARISPMVRWPRKDALNVTVPFQFVEVYGKRVAVILDCFEVSTQRPSNLGGEEQPLSDGKPNKTVKYLIGVTPQGSVAFFSKGWEGGLSSRQIAEKSGILDKLMPGDLSLPAEGPDNKESLGLLCDEIISPPPAKGGHKADAEDRLKIKNLKIHVKRIIGNIRIKYSILTAKVPISMVAPCKGETVSILDKTVAVSCALTNMCPNVVEKHKWR